MNLTEGTEKRLEDLKKKSKSASTYTNCQIYLSILVISGFMIYYYFFKGHRSFDGILENYQFICMVIGIAIYNTALEKAGKEAKARFTSSQNKFKEYMNFVGVCDCASSCRCKQELYDKYSSEGLL